MSVGYELTCRWARSAYGTEYQDWLDKNGDRLTAASEKTGSGFDLALVSLHASAEDVQLKMYCSLVGECGSNTSSLLREAGYNEEADWLDKKNFVVGAAGYVEGIWDRGVENIKGIAGLSPVAQLLNLGARRRMGRRRGPTSAQMAIGLPSVHVRVLRWMASRSPSMRTWKNRPLPHTTSPAGGTNVASPTLKVWCSSRES